MAQPNDSVSITPGTGAVIATQVVSSKEFQAVIPTDSAGNMVGTVPTYVVQTGLISNGNAANRVAFDLFNASASAVVTVHGLFLIPSLATVTGVGLAWELRRTQSVGTGGTTVTSIPMDTANGAHDAGITFRSIPTGGATNDATWGGTPFLSPQTSSEETSPYATNASVLNHLGIVGDDWLQEPVFRPGQGFKCVTVTNAGNTGQTNIVVLFTVV
jgi:hypothetical protein